MGPREENTPPGGVPRTKQTYASDPESQPSRSTHRSPSGAKAPPGAGGRCSGKPKGNGTPEAGQAERASLSLAIRA